MYDAEVVVTWTNTTALPKSIRIIDEGQNDINGRSVTFMSGLEAVEQAQLPQALKERLPKPKRVRVW